MFANMGLKNIVGVIIKMKKFFLPTEHDKQQRKLYQQRLLFYSEFIGKGDLCFDIGANIGDRTQIFLDLGANVFSVEPQESCCENLKKRFGNKITLVEKGVGSKEEVKDFYISDYSQVSSFSTEWIDNLKRERFKNAEWNKKVPIEITTLDNIIPINKIPAFIKIDVEGFELEVLKGLSKPFKYLSFEFAVPDNLDNLKKCLLQLQSSHNSLSCNYAVLDNTFLELTNWINIDEMIQVVSEKKFIDNNAGDIYIKAN